jgi:hypothetical protein
VEQLDWHWSAQARPRLRGLTDAEYRWEPVPGCWNVRPRSSPHGTALRGSGEFGLDLAWPEPKIPPVTTIAWRMAHIIVGVFGARSAAHFGGPPTSWDTHPYAGSAADALDQLDSAYATWTKGVRGLGPEGIHQPCGPAEGPFADYQLASLVLHINREAIHHLAEIALLRDLYRAGGGVSGDGGVPGGSVLGGSVLGGAPGGRIQRAIDGNQEG